MSWVAVIKEGGLRALALAWKAKSKATRVLKKGELGTGRKTSKLELPKASWSDRFWGSFIKILLLKEVLEIVTSTIGKGFGFAFLGFAKVWPDHAGTLVGMAAEAIIEYEPLAKRLAAETMEQIIGARIPINDPVKDPSPTARRNDVLNTGSAFLGVVTSMFDVNAARQDFENRTGEGGSFNNLAAYFGTNLTFQLRSLTIGTISTLTGVSTLRHLENLHQSVNWAFGFGWLSWTVMSEYMGVAVLPGVRRALLSQVKPNDYSESEIFSAHLAGMEERPVFDQVLNNLGLRVDVRDNLLDLREADLSESNIRELFEDGDLDDADILRMFRLRGYREERARWKTDIIVGQRIRKINEDLLTSLGRQYRDCAIPEANLRAALSINGYTSAEEDLAVAYWENERRNRRFMSLGQYRQAISQGLLTMTDWESDLRCQGFTDRDISIIPQLGAEEALELPRISAFSISPSALTGAGQVEITWRVDLRGQGGRVFIEPGIGTVQPVGSIIVDVDQNTTYTITAENNDGETKRLESVIVKEARPERPPSVSFSVSPGRFNQDEVPQFIEVRWQTSRADTVVISPLLGPVPTQGSRVVPVLLTTTFSIVATGPGGETRQERTVVAEIPFDSTGDDTTRPFPASFSIAPSRAKAGDEIEVRWDAPAAERVTITPMIGEVEAVGSRIVTLTENTTFTLVAEREEDKVTRVRTVRVVQPVVDEEEEEIPNPSVTLSIRPGTVEPGEDFELRWSSRNADRVTIEPGLGFVSSVGSRILQRQANTTFTATATNEAGEAVAERSLIVVPPPAATPEPLPPSPRVTLSLRPGTITRGDPVELEWTSRNVDTVDISPNIGAVGKQGSRVIFPSTTTTYRIRGTGPGGQAEDDNSLIVLDPAPLPEPTPEAPPTVSFSVRPGTIDKGDPYEVRWSTTRATSVRINPILGSVGPVGSRLLTADESTTFILTAEGPGGKTERAVSLIVRPPAPPQDAPEPAPPSASLSITPGRISGPTDIEVRWRTNRATSVEISPQIGSVDASGARVVNVTKTVVFRLVARGEGGEVVVEDAVVLDPPPPSPLPKDPPAPTGSFSVSPRTIDAGELVDFRWNIRNADTVTIQPTIGPVTSGGSIVLPVSTTTIYQLTAISPAGQLTLQDAVIVRPPKEESGGDE